MNKFLLVIISCTTILLTVQSYAQSGTQFRGGQGSGYITEHNLNSSVSNLAGGSHSGYFEIEFLSSSNSFTAGGSFSGYYAYVIVYGGNGSLAGGDFSGYVNSIYLSDDHNFLQGGEKDGYYSFCLYHTLTWTGVSDSDWNNPSNWLPKVKPSYLRSASIPANTDFSPILNGNLLMVSSAPNIHHYQIESLKIEEGAKVVLNKDLKVINHGMIRIEGSLLFYHTGLGAIINENEGVIELSPTGNFHVLKN